MGIFYILVGISHFTSPIWYVQIVPPSLPYKLELVYVSGLFEILFGGMLFSGRPVRVIRMGLGMQMLGNPIV